MKVDDYMAMPDSPSLIIESMMPTYDAAVSQQIVVGANPTTTFAAARALDLTTVHSPLLDTAFWLRGLPARLCGNVAPPPPSLVIQEDMALPGWTFLGERRDREIAFGAVGKFWQPSIEWRSISAIDFEGFDEPGWGKIAANFSILPSGPTDTLLTYECRTVTTDPDSRRQFIRYWRLVRPFVGHILRATLRQIRTDATTASPSGVTELWRSP